MHDVVVDALGRIDAACGPARVEELEDRLSRANEEHVRDLELIRDLTRRLVTRGAC